LLLVAVRGEVQMTRLRVSVSVNVTEYGKIGRWLQVSEQEAPRQEVEEVEEAVDGGWQTRARTSVGWSTTWRFVF